MNLKSIKEESISGNKILTLSLSILALLYLLIIFAGFISPYSPTEDEFREYFYHPIKSFHFFDQDFNFHLHPFVFPIFIVDRANNIYSEGRPLCLKISDKKYNEEPFLIDSIKKIKYSPIVIRNSKGKIISTIDELTEKEVNSGEFIGCYPSSPYDFKRNQKYMVEYRNPVNNNLISSITFKAIKSGSSSEANLPPEKTTQKFTLAPFELQLFTLAPPMTLAPSYFTLAPPRNAFNSSEVSLTLIDEKGNKIKDYNYFVETYPIKFFSKGFPYWFFGERDIHLFKPSEGGFIFLFGTDQNGRDVFSRTLYGARVSLTLGIIGALLSSLLGLIIGGISGYFGGFIDTLIMRLTEILMSIPAIYLILAIRNVVPNEFGEIYNKINIFTAQCYAWKNNFYLSAIIFFVLFLSFLLISKIKKRKTNFTKYLFMIIFLLIIFEGDNLVYMSIKIISRIIVPQTTITSEWIYLWIVIIISLIGWASLARIIRGLVLSLKQNAYVLAAKALGASDLYIIRKHILPQTYRFAIIRATLLIPFYILSEVALSFLGVGIQEPAPSWGNMLQYAQNVKVLQNFPWMLIPGFFLFITILSFNFIGDYLSKK